jgi:very-short-patch-repair endonuclease
VQHKAPLPQAGGDGGGPVTARPFKERNTRRAQTLRNEATPAERMLWPYLSKSQLGVKFSRQMPVGPYFADFLSRSAKMIIELDGFSHEMRVDYDAARTQFLVTQGYRVLRFTNQDVLSNVEGVVIAIQRALRELDRPTPNPSRLREGSDVVQEPQALSTTKSSPAGAWREQYPGGVREAPRDGRRPGWA